MKSVILFENEKLMGKMPYNHYNCSIIKLNKEETFDITNKKYNVESILIIFFVVSPISKKYGTMSWIGIISYEGLLQLLNNENENENFWIIKPHLLQNDQGPKCADLRVFKMKENIGVIGYTSLAHRSNIRGIADYYVRASLLYTITNDNLYKKSEEIYNFSEIDGGCFPSKIGGRYKKFEIENDNCEVNNIEFYIKDSDNSKLVNPHKRFKNKMMPDQIKLNGVEVSFNLESTNEDSETHIPKKNIIPAQHLNYFDKIGCFIDYSPPDTSQPDINVQDMISGNVYYNDKLFIDNSFKCKSYKGSTPFIEIENGLWITIVHKKKNNNKKYTYYEYFIVFFDSKSVTVNNNTFLIPNKCVKELPLDLDSFKNEYIYITGLIIIDKIFDISNELLELEVLISYGISDIKSGISSIRIQL